eukprot:403345568
MRFLGFSVILTLGFLLQEREVQCVKSGIAAAIHQDVINSLKDFAIPLMIQQLNDIPKQRIEINQDSFSGFIDNLQFTMNVDTSKGTYVAFNEATNEIIAEIRSISGQMSGHYEAYYGSYKFPSSVSDFLIAIQQGGIEMKIGLTPITQAGPIINGVQKLIPGFVVNPKSFHFQFWNDKLDIQMKDAGFVSWFINLLKPLITELLSVYVESFFPGQLQTQMNDYFMNQQGFMQVDKYFLDYSMMVPSKISGNQIEAYLEGGLYQTMEESQDDKTSTLMSDIKIIPASQGYIQAAVSEYAINQLSKTLNIDKKFDGTISQNQTQDKKIKSFYLTDYIDQFIPNFSELFGHMGYVSYTITHTQEPKIQLQENDLQIIFNFDFTMILDSNNKEVCTFHFENAVMDTGISFDKDHMKIRVEGKDLDFGTVTLVRNSPDFTEPIDVEEFESALFRIKFQFMIAFLALKNDS